MLSRPQDDEKSTILVPFGTSNQFVLASLAVARLADNDLKVTQAVIALAQHLRECRWSQTGQSRRMVTEENTETQSRRMGLELQFRDNLIDLLDRLGYRVTNVKPADKREKDVLGKRCENVPSRASTFWDILFAHPKDESVPFCLAVWLSNDVPTPSTFKWRPLNIDGMSVAGPFKRTVWNGAAVIDATPSLGYHVSIIDARLRFEALPLPVMRDTLLEGHLAEELASKVALAFDRISVLHTDRPVQPTCLRDT